jgi:hypothetical protein
MLTREFTAMVNRVVTIACVVVVVIGLVYQVISAELRHDPVLFSTVVESRQTWLGDWGVFPIIFVVILLGIVYKALFIVSKQLDNSVNVIRVELGGLLLRVSSAIEGVKGFLPAQ